MNVPFVSEKIVWVIPIKVSLEKEKKERKKAIPSKKIQLLRKERKEVYQEVFPQNLKLNERYVKSKIWILLKSPFDTEKKKYFVNVVHDQVYIVPSNGVE